MFHKARLYGSGLNRGVTLILQRRSREWREVRMGSVSAGISKSCLTFSLLSCKFKELIFWTKNNVFAKRQRQTPLVLQLQKAGRHLCRHHFKRSNTSMRSLYSVCCMAWILLIILIPPWHHLMEIKKKIWFCCHIIAVLFCTVRVIQLHQSGPQSIRVKCGKFCGHLIQEVETVLSLATQDIYTGMKYSAQLASP